MNRLKIYRRCLIAALLLAVMTLGIYGFYYMSNQVPDEIRISEEETQTLDLGLKEVSVRVVKREKVIPGGIPVGIYLETQGVPYRRQTGCSVSLQGRQFSLEIIFWR